MNFPIYQIDAFTSRRFHGNPAAVVILDQWLPDGAMAAVAAENNLAETAFVLLANEVVPLRWFTPAVEVDLCGHATLAASHMLWETGEVALSEPITFHTRSGPLIATKNGAISLDFPAKAITTAPLPFAPKFLPKAVYTG